MIRKMKDIGSGRRLFLSNGLGAIVLLIILVCFASGTQAFSQERIIACGADEVFILEITQKTTTPPKLIWTWKAADSPEIPSEGRSSFASTDECKPVGESILITSSSGGVALIRRNDKRCEFYTQARNAHSACLLPEDRLAVASSFGGDELLIYALVQPGAAPTEPIARIPLLGAHGVVWDEALDRLWALGEDELLLVNINVGSNDSALGIDKRIRLPTPGGHDLSRSRDATVLYVTTNKHVYRFHTKDGRFVPDPVLADEPKVKSVSEHPRTGEIVYHQGTPENWWSDRIRFIGDRKEIHLPGRRLYKVRWDE
ncbi:MAG: DUF6528 family protein [Planctomycetota bacterium]